MTPTTTTTTSTTAPTGSTPPGDHDTHRWPHPAVRGPLSRDLAAVLTGSGDPATPADTARHAVQAHADRPERMLLDDDLQAALATVYELSFQGIDGVDDAWEDDPAIAAVRRVLEEALDAALAGLTPPPPASGSLAQTLWDLTAPSGEPGFAHRMARRADLHDFREIAVLRSLYQLREADAHTLAVPRLPAAVKCALLEVQWDEYGGADPGRMHSRLFAATMRELGLRDRFGHYVDAVPAPALALLNVLSRYALRRGTVPELIGTLVAIETTSSLPSRNYAAGLRRLGFGPEATRFYDEHVEADAVHEQIVVNDLATGVAALYPDGDRRVAFGAAAYLAVEDLLFAQIAQAWDAGRSALRPSAVTPDREAA